MAASVDQALVEFLREHKSEGMFSAEDLADKLGAKHPKQITELYLGKDKGASMRKRGIRCKQDEEGVWRYYAIDVGPKLRVVESNEVSDDPRPIIDVKPDARPDNVAEGIKALATLEDVYVSNHEIVRLHLKNGRIELTPFTSATLTVALMQAAQWRVWRRDRSNTLVPSFAEPTPGIVASILEQSVYKGLPEILGITTGPLVTIPKAVEFHTTTGFVRTDSDSDAGYYVYAPHPWPVPPTLIEKYESGEGMTVEEAHAILCDPLQGFKFLNPGPSIAAVYAIILQNILRPLIPGPVPGLEVKAAKGKAGKSLLSRYIHAVCFGTLPIEASLPIDSKSNKLDKKELENQLAVEGLNRDMMKIWDNCDTEIGGEKLEGCFTGTDLSFRLFHLQKNAHVRWIKTLIFNGCDPTLLNNMRRRVLRVQLLENHQKNFSWGKENVFLKRVMNPAQRAVLIDALLTIIRHYFDHPEKHPDNYWASFGAWSDLIPGILQCAGFSNPLDACIPDEEERDPIDLEAAAVLNLVSAVFENIEQKKVCIPFVKMLHVPNIQAIKVKDLIAEINGSMGASKPAYTEGYVILQAAISKKNKPLDPGEDTRKICGHFKFLKLNTREENGYTCRIGQDREGNAVVAVYKTTPDKG